MIRLDDVTLSVAGRELLRGVSWHVRPGERIALIGHNGSGKTTLLRTMAGERSQDTGQIHRRGGARVGYLPQDAVSGSSAPLWDEVRSGAEPLLALEQRLERALEGLDGSPASIAAHARAEDAWREAGGYAFDEKVGAVLHGLGFRKEDWRAPCDRFSGGWQMRIALARLLVGEPDLLLLDEPTNHLDLYSRSWLAGFLAKWRGAVVLVSHDRFLLDACATRVTEVRALGLDSYTGNYTRALELRALRDAEREAERARQLGELERAQAMVERFGAKATKSRQAHSRLKRATREPVTEALERRARPRLRFRAEELRWDRAIELSRAAIGYPEHPPILEGVSLEIRRGERWFLLGPNGSGKSTLLKTLAGQLRPLSGNRALGERIRIGWYEQDQAQALPPDRDGLQHLLEMDPFSPESRARAALGALGLTGEQALQPIGSLSGGEKARVALSALTLTPRDLLLLDEPTNHLDAETCDVLSEALADFPGAVVVSTHDRRLVERLATHVLRLDPDGLTAHEGVYPEDFEPVQARATRAAATPAAAAEDATSGADAYRAQKKRHRILDRARRRLEEAEAAVGALEDALEETDAALAEQAADPAAIAALLEARAAQEASLESAMAEWEAAEAALEVAEG